MKGVTEFTLICIAMLALYLTWSENHPHIASWFAAETKIVENTDIIASQNTTHATPVNQVVLTPGQPFSVTATSLQTGASKPTTRQPDLVASPQTNWTEEKIRNAGLKLKTKLIAGTYKSNESLEKRYVRYVTFDAQRARTLHEISESLIKETRSPQDSSLCLKAFIQTVSLSFNLEDEIEVATSIIQALDASIRTLQESSTLDERLLATLEEANGWLAELRDVRNRLKAREIQQDTNIRSAEILAEHLRQNTKTLQGAEALKLLGKMVDETN